MALVFEHELALAGHPTRVVEIEGGTGTPLLLLHGYADSADTWWGTLDLLVRHGRRAVAVDMPGFGRAGALAGGEILPQLDAFVAEAVRYAGGGAGVAIVGNSLGGCLAMRAAQDPDLPVEGIVPVAPAGLDMARWFALIARNPFIRPLLTVPVPYPPLVVRRAVGQAYLTLAFARPGEVDSRVVSAFTSHISSRGHIRRLYATAERLLPELADPFALDRIRCPLLLVWGEHDRMVFPTGAEKVIGAVPGSRLELIPNCGHCPQIECAEEFVEMLVEFPARLARAA